MKMQVRIGRWTRRSSGPKRPNAGLHFLLDLDYVAVSKSMKRHPAGRIAPMAGSNQPQRAITAIVATKARWARLTNASLANNAGSVARMDRPGVIFGIIQQWSARICEKGPFFAVK